jgi:alpha-mannosidase
MRLRALFPLPFRTESVVTEGHFQVASRTLEPEPWNGRSAERPTATFPQKTFSALERDGAGAAIFNRGLPEGEVVDANGVQSYALTLLRAVGWLSRPDLGTRDGGAGPTIRTVGSQMQGLHRFDYAWTTWSGTWQTAGVQAMAHAYAFPPVAWPVTGFDGGAQRLAAAGIEGGVFSALHRSHIDGVPVVRVYRASDEAGTVRIRLPIAATNVEITNLLERKPEAVETSAPGAWECRLRPWQIATFRVPG